MRKQVQFIFLSLLIGSWTNAFGQVPFSVELVPVSVNNSPAIHSFAYGTHNGKWVFMCGRTNGLHGFVPPPGAFPQNGANLNIQVVDPVGNQSYSSPISSLPASIQDQLKSTNPQFWQEGNTLYVIGGFGHLGQGQGFTTYDYLLAVDVPGLIDAVINGNPISPYFRQVSDSRLKVTGGELRRMDDFYYLVFGHSWEGGYNRNDPNMGSQVYTHEVKKFKIEDNGTSLGISQYSTMRDTVNFRRRDLTVVPSVTPAGDPILEALGGVFRANIDLPHLNPVTIDAGSAVMDPGFEQMTSHYTTANISLFDSTTGDRYLLLMGGIGLYYFDDLSQTLVMDSLVPFVDNMTVLTKNNADVWQETILGTKMPSLLGSNAFVILQEGIPQIVDEVIRYDQLTGRTLVGHFFGGIAATQPNNGPSTANGQIYEVYITPGATSAQTPVVTHNDIQFTSFPNPTSGEINFEVVLNAPEKLKLDIFDPAGKLIEKIADRRMPRGTHVFPVFLQDLPNGVYIARLNIRDRTQFIRFQYIDQ